jgi:uncharacterized membrane protein
MNPELQNPAVGGAPYATGDPYATDGAPLQTGAPATLQPIYAPGQTTPTYATNPQEKDRSGLAVASLVLGILGIPCCVFYVGGLFGVLAIIFGCLGLKSSKRGMAIAGIICGAVSVLLLVFLIMIIAVLYPDMLANPEDYGLPSNFEDYI